MKSAVSVLALAALGVVLSGCVSSTEPGRTDDSLVLGSVLALKGPAQGLGQGMRDGLEAALRGQSVKGRQIELRFLDDSYNPVKTVESTQRLLEEEPGAFLMVGNVGTPTATVSLPILRETGTPAVGFFTGAGILRPGDGGPILNYRASYVQEVGAVVTEAIDHGIAPEEVCAYVQNDAYGMAGIEGVRQALMEHDAPADLIEPYEEILSRSGDNPVRNQIGPVGVYPRNTTEVEAGYRSLKTWERRSGNACRLVVTVGAYENIAHFVRYARQQGEDDWVISAVSFTGADSFRERLDRYGVDSGVLMTQVVPLPESDLPIVSEARQVLGQRFGFVSLEGYIVGKMLLELLEGVPGELTREGFMEHARTTRFDLGGVEIDFTRDGNQASQMVNVSQLTDEGWQAISEAFWQRSAGG